MVGSGWTLYDTEDNIIAVAMAAMRCYSDTGGGRHVLCLEQRTSWQTTHHLYDKGFAGLCERACMYMCVFVSVCVFVYVCCCMCVCVCVFLRACLCVP